MIALVQRILGKLNIKVNLSDKLTGDILWNLLSFVLIAINGVVLNILILSRYGSASLGLFNQIYASFIVLSQLAVNGIHFSVLKTISLGGDSRDSSQKFTSALTLAAVVSALVIGLIYPLVNQASRIFDSQYMTAGIKLVLPGLVFFAMNKVVLAFLTGQRRMKLFATFQALRSVFLLVFLLLHIWIIHDGNTVSMIFSLSEGLLFITLVPILIKNFCLRFDKTFFQNTAQHFIFGLQATGGNILLELNTKVDILILGLFVTDSQVGIYSFAALFIEGFMQLPTIIRNNINPILATRYHQSNRSDFKTFLRSVIRYSYLVFVPLGIVGMLVFPIVGLVKTDVNIQTAWLYFGIMLAGMLAASGYLPLLMSFNQAGKPEIQSLVLLCITLVLAVSVLGFTICWGTLGAAIGVGFSYVAQAVIIYLFLRKIERSII